jgi:hypothetical protein
MESRLIHFAIQKQGTYMHFMYIYWIASRLNQNWIENDKSSCHFSEQITIQKISHLFMDNYYLLVLIFRYLHNMEHNVIGTVRLN